MAAQLEAPKTETAYEATFREQLAKRIADSPDWLQSVRLQALSRFEALGVPTRKQEAWKYINLRSLMGTQFTVFEGKEHNPALQASAYTLAPDVIRLAFVNGRHCPILSDVTKAPESARIVSLADALQNQTLANGRKDAVQTLLGENLDAEPDAFLALNTALFTDGALIDVPANTEITPLVHILFVTTEAEASYANTLRNLVSLGKNAKARLIVQTVGPTKATQPYFNNIGYDFDLAEGASLEVTVIQQDSANAFALSATRASQQAKSQLSINTVTLTGQTVRNSIRALLKGEAAECRMNGLDVLKDASEVYHHTVLEHLVPNCVSDQYYKGILDDSAKSEFNGLVFVAKGADGTDSHQLNKNLVLSDNARVWTRPQLQINADDVKCAHGATVGQLQEDQLFYFASRGLDRELSEAILTYGFAEEIIMRIGCPVVQKALNARVLKALYSRDAAMMKQFTTLGAKP